MLTWNGDADETGTIDVPALPNSVSPYVVFGPYRTLFNKPATITLPYDNDLVGENTSSIEAYIYNEVTHGWDPVYPVPGGKPIEIDTVRHTASFKVQVLGIFVLGIL